ncbi:ABC transporter permease [Carboxylicivirga sediminis]|uniref:ABC transporter permease n=1 Tax=Carboxylicivirga sediminis TaxID=2006564 RepID=A0A941IX47_9BACT|nr:ABC transporter permease [Carboxylicivirga sediminis]MBR8535019.1 ABC transporter permease [Carboxylicivirga sediminis]
MLYHYLLIAWRNLKRKKTLSFIQVVCLSIGLAAFFLVARYVQYEQDFDKFNANYEHIYRAQTYKVGDKTDDWYQIPVPVAQYLKEHVPEVDDAFVIRQIWFEFLSPDKGTVYKEFKGYKAPSAIFEMFSFELRQGNRHTVLDAPNAIVISESMAERYFPGENAMGKIIYDGQKEELVVSGIMKDVPEQSHLAVDYFRSSATLLKNYADNWYNNSFSVYVQLKPNTSVDDINRKIDEVIHKHDPDARRVLYLNPLSTLHLKENPRDDRGAVVYIFSVMGLMILLLACVSFMNLTTAFSSLRQVEIGVRKSIGSSRKSIAIQFLSETLFIAIVAFVLAVFLAHMLLPVFNNVVNRHIELNLFADYRFTLFLLGVVLLTGLLSGAYPAFVVSNYRPVVVLKRSNLVKQNRFSALQAMVYFQFILSVVLITVSLWTYRQVNFLINKDLGFQKEHLLHCTLPAQESRISHDALRDEILAHPGIENMSMSINSPLHANWGCQIIPEGWSSENSVFSRWNAACSNFINTMGMQLVEGRNFSDDLASDEQACLINETAARAFGWQQPIGKQLEKEGTYKVVGVIKDFNIEDVHNPVNPYVLLFIDRDLSQALDLTFKVHPQTTASSLQHINQVMNKHFTDVLFEVNSYDTNLPREELKIWNNAKNTVLFFTVMAVVIAAMGLFGLIYYAAQRRVKEIGVRKVQGARAYQIFPLITKKYLLMAVTANIVVYPVAMFLKDTMPGQFKYQFTILDAGIILLLSILITLISSGYQVIKASSLNPVEALRYE